MSRLALRGPKARAIFRPRPFLAAVSIVTLLVAVSYLQTTVFGRPGGAPLLRRSSDDTNKCRDVHQADDVCAFVRANCEHEQPSLIPYLNIYYCTFTYARVAGFVLLVLWLGLLFSTIGIAASDFFTPNLQTVAYVLSMPENLTGVTFLALGNGSPDLFSTIMSMRSNSAALAVGELIGAASFITAIVAGSIAMIREFKVEKHSFTRDLVFFIVAITFTLGFLLDGTLRGSECIFMIAYYACYVMVVSGSHCYITSRNRRVARAEERARAVNESLREEGRERYRDQEETGTVRVPAQVPSASPIHEATPSRGPSADTMPRIEIEGTQADEEPESEREHSKHIGAEIANSMRVRRSIGARRNTGNLIRPSLVGALELNSALERFRREGPAETHSPGHTRRHSMQNVPQVARSHHESAEGAVIAVDGMPAARRDRAVSHTGNLTAPTGRHGGVPPGHLDTAIAEGSTTSGQSTPRHPEPRLPGRSFQLDGNLAVPPAGQPVPRPDQPGKRTNSGQKSLAPGSIDIPSRRSTSSDYSETLSPFPGFTESPLPMTPTSEVGQTEPPQLPLLSAAANIINNNINNCYSNEIDGDGDLRGQIALRWWPYSILPPPEAIAATLFPTLQNWSEKGTMDAFVSLLSVPTVFLLSITLPVVDTRCSDPDEETECTRLNADIEASRRLADTEWEEFRRHRRAHSRDSSVSGSATPLSPMSRRDVPLRCAWPARKVVRGPDGQSIQGLETDNGSITSDELMGWNKWQVLLQVIAGPPFAVLIITSLLLEQPQDVTLAAIQWSSVASGVLFFIVLLTTKQDVRPRFHSLFCFPGFLVSVAWIAAIAGEVVGALKAIGVIWSISEAILGLTIFAAGNSVGDWVSNYTIARLGSPVMAL